MAAMVAALDSMHGVTGKAEFFAQAANADLRSTAFFMRKLAERMAREIARSTTCAWWRLAACRLR